MSFSTGLALFFVLFIGGLAGIFLWLWILELKEKREVSERLQAAADAHVARHAAEVASARTELAKLSPEEIRAGLRLSVGRAGAYHEGLVHCSRPLTATIDCRLVMEGIALRGLEREARARLSEDDAALVSLATSQTLGAPPTTRERAPLAWLAALETLLPGEPAVLVAVGPEVRWISPPAAAGELVALVILRAPEPGPLDGALLFWDGATLVDIRRFTPTLRGPTTPDVILTLPPALCELTGLPAQLSARFD